MNHRAVFCCLLLFLTAASRADEETRSTQEELRRRNIFFGDIDGRASGEFEEALKRYQSRKGLAATGRTDRETLRSLGLATRTPGESVPKIAEWPEEPILKSDTKINAVAVAGEISQSTGVSSDSLLPEPATTRSLSRTGTRQRKPVSKPGSHPAEGPGPAAIGFSVGNQARLQPELATYVRNYLRAVSRNRLPDELHFYADRVNYLGNGVVDRRVIEQSLRKYYQHWPRRSCSQIGEISYRANPRRGEVVVSFRAAFSLGNGASRVKGQTINQIVINAATTDPRIVSITEQRVRR